ncbi:MAG: hypothetical protein ABSA17_06340 [Rhabdochlamydiaceae bacterium]|jgi:hypothetical protein
MCKVDIAAQSLQVGHHDPETYEIIELINSYVHPADFFLWLSGASFTEKVLHEAVADRKLTKISQYYIRDSLVFTQRAEFDLRKFPKDAIQFLMNGKMPIISSIPGFTKFGKQPYSRISTELHYTVISRLCILDEPAGSSWEIYELPRIIEIYKKMDDPLRSWRNR